jgi:DNA invertase Pin-like site-specific DNA recombinase
VLTSVIEWIRRHIPHALAQAKPRGDANQTRRRAPAPFLKAEAIQNLGKHAVGFGKAFERRVRALFDKGLTDAAIARALDVGLATVTYRTMHWRKRKRERRLRSPRSELPSRG